MKDNQITIFGWTCPRCMKVHSPYSTQCDCPPPTYTTSSSSFILPTTFHPATTGFGDHTPANEKAMQQLKKITKRDEILLHDWCNGMRQMNIANKYKISKTRVRQIISKYRNLLPEEKRI
ncbi:MAG: hypothetical protein JNL69_00705 [Bacteroidia bacterium]|nr:hypothetical protein [Bacteroidia bacterium]